MWNDRLRLAASTHNDWLALTAEERAIAAEALERIDDDPIAGTPLFEPLKGLWSYRSGTVRIVYRIVPESRFVVVLGIGRARPVDE